VWQEAVTFAEQCLKMVDTIETGRKHYRLVEQLENDLGDVHQNISYLPISVPLQILADHRPASHSTIFFTDFSLDVKSVTVFLLI
jgi:hypothetical protein